MHSKTRACVATVVVLTILVAAGCADAPEERRAALAELVDAFGLEPEPGEAPLRIGRTKSKSDYPYYTVTGVLDEPTREAGVARVVAAFEREGWEVFESGVEPIFLGWCVRARSGSMVANSHVGWVTRPGFNPYPRLPGRVYVQTAVGREGSNQVWTDPDRPSCGA